MTKEVQYFWATKVGAEEANDSNAGFNLVCHDLEPICRTMVYRGRHFTCVDGVRWCNGAMACGGALACNGTMACGGVMTCGGAMTCNGVQQCNSTTACYVRIECDGV